MTGSPNDREEHIDRCACTGIQHVVVQLAAIKNLTVRESDSAQIAGNIASNLGPWGRERFVEGPDLAIRREIVWQTNNCLDWMASHDLVLTYMFVHTMQMPSEALGLAVSNVLHAFKGSNPVDGPTWRWPDPEIIGRAVAERGASAWPLDPVALGVCAVQPEGARA